MFLIWLLPILISLKLTVSSVINTSTLASNPVSDVATNTASPFLLHLTVQLLPLVLVETISQLSTRFNTDQVITEFNGCSSAFTVNASPTTTCASSLSSTILYSLSIYSSSTNNSYK